MSGTSCGTRTTTGITTKGDQLDILAYAVSKWIGDSITASEEHRADSIPDELFQNVGMQQKGLSKLCRT